MKFRRVCFFLPSAYRDGAELSALECMDALKSLGIQCRVVLPQRGPLMAELESRQIPYQLVPYKVWIEPPVSVWKGLLVTFWNLCMAYVATVMLARWKCDLVITNTINICVGALVAKLQGLPHIWYLREFGYEDHGWRYHLGERLSLWMMDRLSVACLAVSRAVSQKYKTCITPAKLQYLYQPINVDLSSRPDLAFKNQQFLLTCIMVGRLQQGKRQEDAILALGELRDQGIQAKLWLVGGGDDDYYNFLQKLIHKRNLKENVIFFGQVDHALPYIQQADVLLLCSRCEAFARVVIEAMKLGKPVLGTRRGGTVEQVEEGFNGFLFEPKNYKELAEKIKYLHDHPPVLRKMGKNARRWAMKTFNTNHYRNEIKKVLDQI